MPPGKGSIRLYMYIYFTSSATVIFSVKLVFMLIDRTTDPPIVNSQ